MFISLGNIPRSGIAGSYDNSMLNFFRKCQTVLQNGCIILHSCQQCTKVTISLYPWQCSLLSGHLFDFNYPSGVK